MCAETISAKERLIGWVGLLMMGSEIGIGVIDGGHIPDLLREFQKIRGGEAGEKPSILRE